MIDDGSDGTRASRAAGIRPMYAGLITQQGRLLAGERAHRTARHAARWRSRDGDHRGMSGQCESALISRTPSSTHPNTIAPTTICFRTKNVSTLAPRLRKRRKDHAHRPSRAMSFEQRDLDGDPPQ